MVTGFSVYLTAYVFVRSSNNEIILCLETGKHLAQVG